MINAIKREKVFYSKCDKYYADFCIHIPQNKYYPKYLKNVPTISFITTPRFKPVQLKNIFFGIQKNIEECLAIKLN